MLLPETPRRRTCAAILAGIAIVALAGCGDSDDNSATSPPTVTTTTEPSPGATDPASPATGNTDGAAGETPAPAGDAEALDRAGGTAVGAVPGSTLISIEREGGGTWEVQVVTPDGVEHGADVSADGTQIVAGPTVDDEDADDRAKHQARIQAARLDYAAAADAVRAAIPGAAITELNLDDHGGATVWEADVYTDPGIKHEVTVDAVTGQVQWR
ncbi:PepSY domain-containing protein [Prescottella sp. R16]|uniref:PepSY domain-containing protein n=1 Tax=Prescottella sp. R16 TaxID=3064529 RepID=UPI00272E6018|nr:PepSY domain-containing protein [Prescottella sp. R16]